MRTYLKCGLRMDLVVEWGWPSEVKTHFQGQLSCLKGIYHKRKGSISTFIPVSGFSSARLHLVTQTWKSDKWGNTPFLMVYCLFVGFFLVRTILDTKLGYTTKYKFTHIIKAFSLNKLMFMTRLCTLLMFIVISTIRNKKRITPAMVAICSLSWRSP